jgi:hypothetical protein
MNLLACENSVTVTSEGIAKCSSGFTTINVDLSSLISPITINALFEIPSAAELTQAFWIPLSTILLCHLVSRAYDHLISFMSEQKY